MKIEMWPIDKVKPYPGNPRQNDDAVEGVARSLREFGWQQPIVVDKDGVIIVGHTRHKAAKKNGDVTVPVHVARDLTPEKIKAYRIADNQLATLASWDDELLAKEIKELLAADYDTTLLGFDDNEMAALLGPTAGLTDPDEIPPVPKNPITKPGDLWLLGAYWQCEKCGKEYDYETGKTMKECPCG